MVMPAAFPDTGHQPDFVKEKPFDRPGDSGLRDGADGAPFTIAGVVEAEVRAFRAQSVGEDVGDPLSSGPFQDQRRLEEAHRNGTAARAKGDLDLVRA